MINELKDDLKTYTCIQKFIWIMSVSLPIVMLIIVGIDSITNKLATCLGTTPEKVRLSCIFISLGILTLWTLMIILRDYLTKTHSLLGMLWFTLLWLFFAYIYLFFDILLTDIVNNPDAVDNLNAVDNRKKALLEHISAGMGGIIVAIGVAAVSLNIDAIMEKNRLHEIEAATNNLTSTESLTRIISFYRLYDIARGRNIYIRQNIYDILVICHRSVRRKTGFSEEEKILSDILDKLESMGIIESKR